MGFYILLVNSLIKSYLSSLTDSKIYIISPFCVVSLRLTKEEKREESRCNYERYRVLVQNGFHGVSEADALAKINVEEMYPEPSKKSNKKSK